jgi:hypothetical protein
VHYKSNLIPCTPTIHFPISIFNYFDCVSSSTSDQQPQTHRPLKQEEIENSLDVVPLYAIASTENDSILLIDDIHKNIANFYLSREFAEKIASGYNDVKVDVYSLGKICFQHFDPDAPSIGVKKLTANEKKC